MPFRRELTFSRGAEGKPKNVALREILSLGAPGNDLFTQIGEITTDAEENIYVTDEYQYKVKKFNRTGALLNNYGTRGRQPGQFQAGPYEIQCLHDTLAIVEEGSSTVKFYTNNFVPVNDARLGGAVVDFCLTQGGELFSSSIQPPSRSERTLMRYARNGCVASTIDLHGMAHDPILDMTLLCMDKNDNLFVAYLFMNRVLVYDHHQDCISDFTVPSLPNVAATESDLKNLSAMPDNLVSDLAVDNRGNIFILGGLLSPHPNRDVFVTDYHGNLQTRFLLPDQSGIIYLDNRGHLFTREKKRSVVKKYEVIYINF